jgi:hypothetical protein
VTWSWELNGHEGAIRLRATGYTQALRAAGRKHGRARVSEAQTDELLISVSGPGAPGG